MGVKEAICGPVDRQLADACAVTRHSKCHVFIPSPMHACPLYGPLATCKLLRHAKEETEFPGP
jgi:hypothetical protein